MPSILAQTGSSSATLTYVFAGVIALALAGVVLWVRREIGVLKSALKDAAGQSLEQLLRQHLEGRQRMEEKLRESAQRLADLEQHALTTKGRIGLVRYDAFDDVSGRHSFAIAIQNEEGDGVILNSIIGRETSRLYCKQIIGGKCDQALAPEEEEAIRLAARARLAETKQ